MSLAGRPWGTQGGDGAYIAVARISSGQRGVSVITAGSRQGLRCQTVWRSTSRASQEGERGGSFTMDELNEKASNSCRLRAT